MEIKDFFSFGSQLFSTTFLAAPIGLKTDESGVADYLNLIKGKYKGINFPVVFRQEEEGNNLKDVVDTGLVGLFLISDRMKNVLEKNKLTGWQLYPIKVFDKKGNEITGYHGFSIIGHCGPINYEKAEVIEKRLFPTGPLSKYYKGLYVGLDQWDGTDFFTPYENYRTIITKNAEKLLKKEKITNLRLTNLTQHEIDVAYVVNKDA